MVGNFQKGFKKNIIVDPPIKDEAYLAKETNPSWLSVCIKILLTIFLMDWLWYLLLTQDSSFSSGRISSMLQLASMTVVLSIHETGHLLLGIFDTPTNYLLGTFGGFSVELAAVITFAILSFVTKRYFLMVFLVFIIGTQFLYHAWYMSTATQLMTEGLTGEGYHDWYVIFQSLGVLESYLLISSIVRIIGYIICVVGILMAFYNIFVEVYNKLIVSKTSSTS